jgi:CubicO group peptidase (beta-lactamase class C family)/pimeloyl-ACP methyl ester carboxylesterase
VRARPPAISNDKERIMHWFVAVLSIVAALVGPFGVAVPRVAVQDSSPAATAIELPVTPAGEALAWVLSVLNDGAASLTPEEMTARFASTFFESIPPELMMGLVQQIAADAPFTFEGFTRPPTTNQVNALLIGRSGAPLVVPVSVEPTAPHRITGVNFAPVPAPPGVQRQTFKSDEVPLAAGERRTNETGRLDGRFDVDGHRIYLSCVGTGSPTVVLESGLNDPAAPWFAIESAIAPFTRVCTYDRPNTAGGASDPVPLPRTTQDAVDDLHALLVAAKVPGPYVLAGHSFGGLINRLYASTYPEDVGGLVLVDASHEEQDSRLEALVSPELWEAYEERMAQFPNLELDIQASFAQVREARVDVPLRPIPLVVITAGAEVDPAQLAAVFPPGWPVEVMPQLHRELQADLAKLVPNGRQVIAERSGHYVHQGEPELVVEAIRDVVDAVRDPETWDATVPGTPTSALEPGAGFDSLLEAGVNRRLTGVAIVVDQDGQMLFDGVAGLANSEVQTPLSPTDRFRIYSITKTFTAVLTLQLVDEGVLTLDDTVSQWLDDPVVARIPNIDRITIRQLLTHTSGVYDYYNGAASSFVDDAITGEGADWSKVWTAQEVLAYVDGTRQAADFDPGQGVKYSDTGYFLLGLIVEQAGGQSFAEQLHARILDPLGLTDTFFAAAEPVPGGTVEGYHRLGDELINVSGINLSWAWTQGGIVSTTENLARFADALFDGDLIEPASLEAMLTFLPADEQGREWGMGVARVQTPMGGLIGMNGSGPGFVARMYRLPAGATVVLLTNTNLEDDTVNAIFEQAVQVTLGSVAAPVFPVTAGRHAEETL